MLVLVRLWMMQKLCDPHSQLCGIAILLSPPHEIFTNIYCFLTLSDLVNFDLSLITSEQLRPIYLSSLAFISTSSSSCYHPLSQVPDSMIQWISSRQIPLTTLSILPSSSSHPVNLTNIFSSHYLLQHINHLKFISPCGFLVSPTSSSSDSVDREIGDRGHHSSLVSLDFSESSHLLDEHILSIFDHKKSLSHSSSTTTASSLPSRSSYPNLQSLALSNQSHLTSKSLKAILKSQSECSQSSLTNLQLQSCHGIDNSSLKSFLSSKLCKQKLQTLNLQNCSQIFPRTFGEISSQLFDSLTSLNLSSCSLLCDQSLHKILLKCKSLQFLDVSSTHISVTAFSNLPKSSIPLELLANHCSLMNNSCVGIISCIYRKLRKISLTHSPIDHAAVISLSQCSDLHDVTLTLLSSPTNAVPYLLCKCHQLQSISLTGSYLYRTPPPTILQDYLLPTLCPRLSQYGQHITRLSFTQCHFTSSDFHLLSSPSCCPLLSSLTLHSCFSPPSSSSSLHSEEWQELIQVLSSSVALTHLSLSPCEKWPTNTLSEILRARGRSWVSLSLLSSPSQLIPPLTALDMNALSSCCSLETFHMTQLPEESSAGLRRALLPLSRLSSVLL
jgi:hypothetical protein